MNRPLRHERSSDPATPRSVSIPSAGELCRIWDRCYPRLKRIAGGWCDSAGDVDDAIQEAFVRLAATPQFPETLDDPLAWLMRVVRNRLFDLARHRRRRFEPTWLINAVADAADNPQVVDAPFEHQEMREALQRALDQLEPEDREVIVLHIWGDMSFSQIATTTGRSRSHCHRRYQHTLKTLRRFLPAANVL